MKFLCLHGRGTNSEVFQFQTDTLGSLLPESYSYYIPNAEWPCPAAPGLEKMAPELCLCWYPDDSIKSVAEAHELISEMIQDEGPFDGVIGFSQGAALAASLILHRQIEHPLSPPLFQVAIFISAFRPFSRDPSLGRDVTEEQDTFPSPKNDSPFDRCQWFDPTTTKERIQIPTTHIYGEKDPYISQAREVVELSERDCAYTYIHEGGHEIPMQPDVCMGIRDGIVRAVERSETFQ